MKKVRKFFNFVITGGSFYLLLRCIGNIQKDVEPFFSLVGFLVAVGILFYQGYKAGWCYKCFYEEEDE